MKIMNITDFRERPIALLPIGYSHDPDGERERKPLDEVLHFKL